MDDGWIADWHSWNGEKKGTNCRSPFLIFGELDWTGPFCEYYNFYRSIVIFILNYSKRRFREEFEEKGGEMFEWKENI